MAKQTLPVNFKDDILDPSMSGKRKYRLIDNGDGTVSFEDVTTYTQAGSDFGAGQINATNKAVNESCDKADVIDDLDDIVANQANGKIAGAKAVATLNADLSNLINETTTTEYDKTVINFTSAWSTSHCEVYKTGRIVQLSARIYSGTILKDYEYTIANVNTEFRPAHETPIYAVAGDVYMQNLSPCMCLIQPGGKILFKTSGDQKQYVDIAGTYIV